MEVSPSFSLSSLEIKVGGRRRKEEKLEEGWG